jgi:nicotinamidase-related amidase
LWISDKAVFIKKGVHEDHDSYSVFGCKQDKTSLLQNLRELNVAKVYICGLAYDYCVGSTALDSKRKGFDTYVVTDCTKSVNILTGNEMTEKLLKLGVKFIDSSTILGEN